MKLLFWTTALFGLGLGLVIEGNVAYGSESKTIAQRKIASRAIPLELSLPRIAPPPPSRASRSYEVKVRHFSVRSPAMALTGLTVPTAP